MMVSLLTSWKLNFKSKLMHQIGIICQHSNYKYTFDKTRWPSGSGDGLLIQLGLPAWVHLLWWYGAHPYCDVLSSDLINKIKICFIIFQVAQWVWALAKNLEVVSLNAFVICNFSNDCKTYFFGKLLEDLKILTDENILILMYLYLH